LWLRPDLLRVIGCPVASMPLSHVFRVFDKTLLRRAERDPALLFGGRKSSPDTAGHDQKLLGNQPRDGGQHRYALNATPKVLTLHKPAFFAYQLRVCPSTSQRTKHLFPRCNEMNGPVADPRYHGH
jgi:hypothetical protein